MASVTRSRRAEALPPIPLSQRQHRPHSGIATHTRGAGAHHILQQSNSTRSKRPFEPSGHDFDAIRHKKAKLTVEILSRPPVVPLVASQKPSHIANAPSQPPVARPNRAATVVQAPTIDSPVLTKHREKVINGIKHELDRLQPSSADTKEQGRKLRSQEATRFKSELAAYFPDYDEIIGNDPKEQHILNLETPIVVTNPASEDRQHPAPLSSAEASNASKPQKEPVRSYSDALFEKDLFDSQTIDFSFLETRYKGKSLDDPLPDSYFEPAHKKAERLERSIRNSEKGRAQHEKDQIIRLLEGLQGHDWLRTMGVSGITETRKKAFEPAREQFIKGCKSILEKFRLWSLEEKRRKQEKDRVAEEARAREEEMASAEDGEEQEEEEDDDDEVDLVDTSHGQLDEEMDENEDREDVESDGDPPDDSDADEFIAKQLREDAMARSKAVARTASKRAKAAQAERLSPPPPPASAAVEAPPQKEFTSFFHKRYQRDAALSKSRRKGRVVVAWGHPVPDPPEADFDLPEEYRDSETLKSHARRRRRDRRGH